MSEKTQDFTHHTRWDVLYHFIASPIALFNVIIQARHAYYAPTRYALWNVVLSIGFFAIVWSARIMALTVQDRVIRLEMRLKLRELGVPDADIRRITVRQFVGLRFASDAELPGLVQRVVKGELVEQKDIKAAIKDWQADWQRA
jgi:hypothetical protein